jgi:hypothetical protein
MRMTKNQFEYSQTSERRVRKLSNPLIMRPKKGGNEKEAKRTIIKFE